MEEKQRIGYMIKMIDNTYKHEINQKLKDYGLTQTQSSLLLYLARNKDHEISQREIERFMDCTNPTITGILNRLEKNGFIIRKSSSKDARFKCVELSDKANQMHKEIREVLDMNEAHLLACLNENEREQLHDLLSKLLNESIPLKKEVI